MKNIIEILKANGIEVSEDQVNVINKEVLENYKTINDYNKQISKLEATQNTLKETQSSFDEFKKGYEGINIEELKNKVATLTSDIDTQKADFEKKIKTMELDSLISEQANVSGVLDLDLLKTQLDYDELLNSQNQKDDIANMFNKLKDSKPILFKNEDQGNKPKANLIGGVGNPTLSQEEAQLRAIMGLK